MNDGFAESFVEADGFRIRYLHAGDGAPLVYFHGGGGLHVSPALELLAQRFRVLAFQLPGFGDSDENLRTQSLEELAETMTAAVAAAGPERYALAGTSFGGATAIRLALAHQDLLECLVLEAPSAFRQPDFDPMQLTPEQLERALFARPENRPALDPPEVIAKQRALLGRLMGPAHDAELEERLAELTLPVLVLFGTKDGLISPAMGRLYRERLVNCNLVYVYDAAHEMQYDRPQAFADVVGDFVVRQEAFVVNDRSGVINP
jgi:pimeloyl-ACP methyl ester carboxylesterase